LRLFDTNLTTTVLLWSVEGIPILRLPRDIIEAIMNESLSLVRELIVWKAIL